MKEEVWNEEHWKILAIASMENDQNGTEYHLDVLSISSIVFNSHSQNTRFLQFKFGANECLNV